jgi:hypothetical protein
MAMICPQCEGSFEQRMQCPQCGVRLQYEATRRGRWGGRDGEDEPWQQTPWGRLLVGLLLSQGLYYVLRQLFLAGAIVAREEATVWSTLTGLIVLQALQGVSVFAAGLLTGAGRRRGLMYGAVVGLWNGVLFILARQWSGQQAISINLFGDPILQAAFGAIGGLTGSLIWKPAPSLTLPERRPAPGPIVVSQTPSSFAGPVAWGRVLAGITLAVGGVVWVDIIRDFALEAGSGQLRIDTHLQAELVTWEISALAILAGSALAGATTRNGLKQGLAVGVGSATILFGIRLAATHVAPDILILTVMSAFCLSLAGGWFGSQLLPPVLASRRRQMGTVAVP